jgi:hypothetical protein
MGHAAVDSENDDSRTHLSFFGFLILSMIFLRKPAEPGIYLPFLAFDLPKTLLALRSIAASWALLIRPALTA